MKILMIECNAEEIKANRTIIDTLNEALSNFTRPMFGVDFDISKTDLSELEEEDNE